MPGWRTSRNGVFYQHICVHGNQKKRASHQVLNPDLPNKFPLWYSGPHTIWWNEQGISIVIILFFTVVYYSESVGESLERRNAQGCNILSLFGDVGKMKTAHCICHWSEPLNNHWMDNEVSGLLQFLMCFSCSTITMRNLLLCFYLRRKKGSDTDKDPKQLFKCSANFRSGKNKQISLFSLWFNNSQRISCKYIFQLLH